MHSSPRPRSHTPEDHAMKREIQLQTHIVKSVRKDGGYARKLSNRFQVGIPDLIISMPSFAPCFAEVKDFGEVKGEFDRDIGLTEKQAHELTKISKSQIYPIAMVLIGFTQAKKHYLMYLPHTARRVSSSAMKGVLSPIIRRDVGSYYNMRLILQHLDVARIVSSPVKTMERLLESAK